MKIQPEFILNAYANGIFPMAQSVNNKEVEWIKPISRGIIPLNDFYISKSLKKVLKKNNYNIKVDNNFDLIISKCAELTSSREDTWINNTIKSSFLELFSIGYAHSVEVWRDDKLLGGLYGLSLGSAFFGESMFSNEKNGSKIALCYLVAILKIENYSLLDIQFITDHLKRFGAIEILNNKYSTLLNNALLKTCKFSSIISQKDCIEALELHSKTQIS